MGVPKKKRSQSRQRSRNAEQKKFFSGVSICPRCQSPKLSHFACPSCGYYKGRLAVVIKEKKAKKGV